MPTPAAASRPDVAHLTPDALAVLRSSLLGELAVQRAQLDDHRATVAELLAQPATDTTLDREMAEAAAARAAASIADIEHALGRIDDGTYGSCERCGDPVAVERLEAMPSARHCVGCSA